MAQRAYRHRKETTISSLEEQVQHLRRTNEEMSNIFISLYDFALAKGLLQKEPDFGQQLQSTTERFLALAKASQEDNNPEDSHEDGVKHDEPNSGRQAKALRISPEKQQQNPPVSESTTDTWGGYVLSKENSPMEELDLDYQQNRQNRQNQGYRQTGDLQVIAKPTENTASFPFDLMDLQNYRVELPQMEEFSRNFLPQAQPPLPNSYNFNEFSFARRIHRIAEESALKLITNKDPKLSSHRQRVFGLCLLYEDEKTIEARLRRVFEKSTRETLHNWSEPFVHVGGAGTYYPLNDSDIDIGLMPKYRTGYAMGPFTPSVSRAEVVMEDGMKCNLPGFEGEFFDANDVEGYLRNRGLDIAPAADFITGDINLNELAEAASPKSSSDDSVASISSPKTPRASVENMLQTTGRDAKVANYDFPRSDIDSLNVQNVQTCLSFPLGNFEPWDSDSSPKENTNFIDPIFSTISGSHSRSATPEFSSRSRRLGGTERVTLNVNILLEGKSISIQKVVS